MREEMASKLFENFIEGTISLGFTKEEVQKLIDMKYDQRG
jgi:DNA-binding transcriptional regulator YhcF (GntR family)